MDEMRREAMDEEIVTGAATLKLTCPLTYMRMAKPCRADTCHHIQCFDAHSFFSMNEQSPQWLCPVCNRSLEADSLRMDGYVQDILQRVPTDLETVLVETDGSWHSADGAYTQTSPILPQAATTAKEEREALDAMDLAEFLMDDLDEAPDEPEHDPVLGPDRSPPPVPAESAADVIDLTFSSDEE